MRADELLHRHRQEVAVEHRRRLHIGLCQRHGGQLDREAARLPDAALDLLRPSPQMCVARIDVAPGIDDRDDGLVCEFRMVVAHLIKAGSVTEGAKVLDAEPAKASKFLRLLAPGHRQPPLHLRVGRLDCACTEK